MTDHEKDEHLYSLFGWIEGHKSNEYMRKWLGFFSMGHWQAIVSKAGQYMKLKMMKIDQWADGLKNNCWVDVLSLFTLCALITCHTLVHLHNENLWTTVDSPSSYDHDQLLSICHVHLAYLGNGLFMELHERKQQSSWSMAKTTQTSMEATPPDGTTCDTEQMQEQSNNTGTMDNQMVTEATPSDGNTCDTEPMQDQ